MSRTAWLGVANAFATALALSSSAAGATPSADHRGASVSGARVLWVGHSFLGHRDDTVGDARTAIEWVSVFARSSSLAYAADQHIQFGAPLSLLWRGRTHGYTWHAPDLLARRKRLETRTDRYDVLIMTAGVPFERAVRTEYTPYYAQAFACAIRARNPNLRVYLHEGWTPYQAIDPAFGYGPPHRWHWRRSLDVGRPLWLRVAAHATTGRVPAPSVWPRWLWPWTDGSSTCAAPGPIGLIPVAGVLAALHDRLAAERQHPRWQHADGTPLRLGHLFQNPYRAWPSEWPQTDGGPPTRQLADLPLTHPDRAPDDLHLGALGSYVAGLTHFCVIFRRTPLGLPAPDGVPARLARALQETVWRVVSPPARTSP